MELREHVTTALKQAMKDKDTARLATLRLINAAIKDQEIARRGADGETELSDADIRAILAKMIKQRQESVRAYEEGGRLDLAELGMDEQTGERMEALIQRPHGILLVTGPTGSGKSTTLYGALMRLNDRSRNIMTVEDPIEYDLDGIGQTQVNPKVDLTFARGLRAILRQDPDVVMIGEIRDPETARIAVQASMTGHLVLSTLHTNSAVGAINRLVDMGIEPFLLSSSLIGVMAQRLVRKLDRNYRVAFEAGPAELEVAGKAGGVSVTLYRPADDLPPGETGYSGRTGIYELILLDEEMKQLIHARTAEAELSQAARRQSPSMFEDGWNKALAGLTSLDEVLRVTRE